MRAGHWRTLFPVSFDVAIANQSTSTLQSAVLSELSSQLKSLYGNHTRGVSRHGGRQWYADQFLLGCTVDEAVKAGYTLRLAPGPVGRVHIGTAIDHNTIKENTDVHLARFEIENKEHWHWFVRFLNQTNAIGDTLERTFDQYQESWTRALISPS